MSARRYNARFRKADKLDCGFFYPVFDIVPSVRLSKVYLADFLAGVFARVRHGNAHFELVFRRVVAYFKIGVFECSIAKPVTERIAYRRVIIEASRVCALGDDIFVARFGVAVADVYAFRVRHKSRRSHLRVGSVAFTRERRKVFRVRITVYAEVTKRGVVFVFGPVSVGKFSARVNVAD